MTEAKLRDLIAKDIEVLEPGLTLLKKEQYIPPHLGTRSFIDLYAKDRQGHHVLIELKRSNASAREALHEIYKYVEAVKQHFGARDDEIRVIVASTEWKELRSSFSRVKYDTKLAVSCLQLHVDEESGVVTASPARLVPISQGRFISPWHDVNWHLNKDSLDRGIASIEACCRVKGIEDYVIVVLRPPQPVHSEHQAAMRATLERLMGVQHKATPRDAPELPSYEYIAYLAMQALTVDQYLRILDRGSEKIEGIRESIKEMETDEALASLHESLAELEPWPECDHYDSGYPAKFAKLVDEFDCHVQSVRRYGMFDRNAVLDDESILSELRGENASTAQRLKRTLSVSNRAHMASARSDIATCLEQNPAWKNHILRALDEIQQEFPEAEIDILIHNPSTGVFTLYLPITQDDGERYVPRYELLVRNPELVRVYFGGLQAVDSALTFRQILDKYYEGELWGLLFTMTWGSRESRDTEIIEDLGCAYRSFRCDVDGAVETFLMFRDERWRPCGAIHLSSLFAECLEQNENLVRQIVKKFDRRIVGGTFDGSSIEPVLDEAADVEHGQVLGHFFIGATAECVVCGCLLCEEKYMVDGRVQGTEASACMCADCFRFNGEGLGWGVGQLYLRQGQKWLLVAGFPPAVIKSEAKRS